MACSQFSYGAWLLMTGGSLGLGVGLLLYGMVHRVCT